MSDFPAILSFVQTGGTLGCLAIAVWWFNSRDKKRDKDRDVERGQYFKSMEETTNAYRQDAKECQEMAAQRESEFRDFIAKQEQRQREQVGDIIKIHRDDVRTLESRVYESLVTQRAMVIQTQEHLKRITGENYDG